jgi:hypothetical protein
MDLERDCCIECLKNWRIDLMLVDEVLITARTRLLYIFGELSHGNGPIERGR